MAPTTVSHVPVDANNYETPMSRTVQYKKVTKPLLERQRRARINRCLDELKELMSSALASEGENLAKLEKADVLELTVRHLHKLRRESRLAANPVTASDRFRAGFTQCAKEVSVCLAATRGVDVALGTRLMTHLGHSLSNMDRQRNEQGIVGAPTPVICQAPRNGASLYSPPESPVSDCGSTSKFAYNWRPESPVSSGYGSGRDNASSPCPSEAGEMQIDVVNTEYNTAVSIKQEKVWRPW